MGSKRFACIVLNKMFGITMVGGNQQAASHSQRCLHDAANAGIDYFNGLDRGLDYACMANHVSVGVVHDYQVVLPAADMLDGGIGNAGSAHFWLQVIGWHL